MRSLITEPGSLKAITSLGQASKSVELHASVAGYTSLAVFSPGGDIHYRTGATSPTAVVTDPKIGTSTDRPVIINLPTGHTWFAAYAVSGTITVDVWGVTTKQA